MDVQYRSVDKAPSFRSDDGKTKITGVASVAYDGTPNTEFVLRKERNGIPRVVERIMPGAFNEVLAAGPDVRVLRNHDPDNLLGRTRSGTAKVWTNERGDLEYETDVPDTATGRDTVELLKRGDLSGSSFAFVVGQEDFHHEEGKQVVEIKSVSALYDVGPVAFPAYASTSAGVRSGDPQSVLKRVEEWEAKQKAEQEQAERERTERIEALLDRARKAGM